MGSYSSKTKYTTDHSSSDESGGEAIAGEGGVTSPPASSPSCSSLKAYGSSSSTTSKQNSPMGSSLGLLPIPGQTTSNKPLTRPLSTTRPKTKRKVSGQHALKTTCALKYEETLRKDSI